MGLILGLGRSPGEGNCYPLQYSCLENPMDRGTWRATVHGVTKSRIRLSVGDALQDSGINSCSSLHLSFVFELFPLCLMKWIYGPKSFLISCPNQLPNVGRGKLESCCVYFAFICSGFRVKTFQQMNCIKGFSFHIVKCVVMHSSFY